MDTIEIPCDHGRTYPTYDNELPGCPYQARVSLVAWMYGKDHPLFFCNRHYTAFEVSRMIATLQLGKNQPVTVKDVVKI